MNTAERLLEEMRARFLQLGFSVRTAAFFANNGLFIGTPPQDVDGVVVLEHTVFLYFSGDCWHARVTPHGGPHWEKRLMSSAELEAAALEALRSVERPPSPEWLVVE